MSRLDSGCSTPPGRMSVTIPRKQGRGITVLEPDSLVELREHIVARLNEDRALLDELRDHVRHLRGETRRVRPQTATSISLVATDGGNNRIRFDPFLIQLIRVVDSSNNEHCLEAVTSGTRIEDLSAAQFNRDGTPKTALGELMSFLGVRTLPQLSHMIRTDRDGKATSSSWVLTYRQLVEWAILFRILRTKDFATDTLVVVDGQLRSKVFAHDHFPKMLAGIQDAIEQQWNRHRRRIYLVGVVKRSAVLARYRLAMTLEGVLRTGYPAYVEVPRQLEEQVYRWGEWARGADVEQEGREINRFVGGKMFFVKFGSRPHDPIWPIDIFQPQSAEAPTILGCLFADAVNGFPVPHYPRCLQKAHDNAALVDFDFDVLQEHVFAGLRHVLGDQAQTLDAFRLEDADPAHRRYA